MTALVGVQEPRVSAFPAYSSSLGQEAIELAESAGLILDPWQQYVMRHALGRREDERWAAFEVGVNVARQNGKGGILEARELAGLFLMRERMILHSAHEFPTSMEAFLRMEELIEGSADLSREVRSISRSHGSEGFVLKNGQRLRYRTRTKGGGRGFTGDCLILDEAMVLPEPFIGALLPTLSGRSVSGNPQVWFTGSAVDQLVHEHGIVFARIRERGLAGDDPSLAYFEWSAEATGDEGEPLTPDQVPDELLSAAAAWAEANPGLGIRIAPEHVQKERRAMAARTFAVERLGIGDYPIVDGSETVIDVDAWLELSDEDSTIQGETVFAYDVSPERSSSIAKAGAREDGLDHLEVVERRPGTSWVAEYLLELGVTTVRCDPLGPAGSLVPDIEKLGIKVEPITGRDHADACGLLFDRVEEEALRHLGTLELVAALRGAKKRRLGDAWAWDRKSSAVDISPLVAVTIALWGAATLKPVKKPAVGFAFV